MGNAHTRRGVELPPAETPAVLNEAIVQDYNTEVLLEEKRSSRPNSLEIAIQEAFNNMNAVEDLDPKFALSCEKGGGEWMLDDHSFGMSEVPASEED